MMYKIFFISTLLLGMFGFTKPCKDFNSECNRQHAKIADRIKSQVKSEFGLHCEGNGGSVWDEGIKRWHLSFRKYGRLTEDEAFVLYAKAWRICRETVANDTEVHQHLAEGFDIDRDFFLSISISELDGSNVPSGFPCYSGLFNGIIDLATSIGKWEPLQDLATRPLAEVEKQVFGDSKC